MRTLSIKSSYEVIMKLIDEVLQLYLVTKEEAEELLTLSESFKSFKRFIDIISITEEYLRAIRGVKA